MILNIDFPPQLEAQISAEARQHGLQPVDLVRRVVEERFAATSGHKEVRTPKERIAAMDALAEKYADLPVLQDFAFDRGDIYEGKL